METSLQQNYLDAFKGRFTSLMRWHHLDDFWNKLKLKVDDKWFIYHVGDTPPESPVDRKKLLEFIQEIDSLLREEHEEDYCGIVYADSKKEPGLIKIFDPNNLGVVCGFSDNPPLPGWVLSTIPPGGLEDLIPRPANRIRWWNKLWKK